jgi:hypothetical protein
MRIHANVEQRRRERLMVDVARRIAGLFQRRPELVGFTVQRDAAASADTRSAETEFGLAVAEITAQDSYGYPLMETREAIVDTLFDLLDEYPEAHELLRDHTFARTFN